MSTPSDHRSPDYAAGGAIGEVPGSTEPHRFVSAPELEPLALLDGLRARAVHGRNLTLAVVELAPGLVMPEHRHVNEQVGVVIRGDFTFTIGGETRLRRPGDMWVIPAGVPHAVASTGTQGCSLVETFAPARADWESMPREEPSAGRWP